MRLRNACLVFLSATLPLFAAVPDSRPNILWIVADDMSPNLGCYGETVIRTPHLDRLAAEGTRFARAFTTAPVCSPCRSGFITGMYATSIGAHHHRSGRGELKIRLPEGVVPTPARLKAAGYYTCIGSGLPDADRRGQGGKARKARGEALGKTDYNFEWDPAMYDSSDWGGRAPGQPFFMQVQLAGGKLRGGDDTAARRLAERAAAELGSATDPAKVVLPPYYPRDPVLLRDWAAYLDAVRFTDRHVGEVLARLEREGILERTLVIFTSDHGISHARGKQFLYNEGTHVPFIVRGPGVLRGAVREDMIELIDITAVSLAAAGQPVPAGMQARDVLAASYRPRDFVFAARDRCDETVERIRSARSERFLYIRNFLPRRPHLQPNAYKDGKSIVQTLRSLHAAGTLDPLSEKLLFRPERPVEELYEWKNDAWQVSDLAADPARRADLEAMRARLDRWMVETRDRGPELEAMYDSDMAVYLGGRAGKDKGEGGGPEATARNVALMKRWAAEGR
jgi:arylsulfatase A-like enzyme